MNPHPELLRVYKEQFYEKIISHKAELDAFEEQFKKTQLYQDIAKDDFCDNREKYYVDGIRNKHISSCIGSTLGYNNVKGLKLLDAGCGLGDYMVCLNSLGYNCTGILGGKYFYDDFKFIHKLLNLNVIYGDLKETLPFQNQEFDAVFCCITLSVKNLIRYYYPILSEFRRICKRDGKIIIVTHQGRDKDKFLKINEQRLLKDDRIMIKSWSEVKWRHEPTLEVETLE